jgi:hypothetical protein
MHTYNAEHTLGHVWIGRQHIMHEVIECPEGFHSGESASCDQETQQRSLLCPAFRSSHHSRGTTAVVSLTASLHYCLAV